MILTPHIDNQLSREQGGFRASEEALRHICTLYEVVRRRTIAGKPTYLFFGDLKKAFDMVPHGAIVSQLRKLGTSESMLDWMKDVLDNSMAKVKSGTLYSREYRLERGAKQGAIPSPLAYIAFAEPLAKGLQTLGDGIEIPGLAEPLPCLIFTNDHLGLSETLEGLDRVISNSDEWATDWGMEWSSPKCRVMLIGASEGERELFNKKVFHVKDGVILHVSEYKYLGVNVTEHWGKLRPKKADLASFVQQRKEAVGGALNRL
jgi:Reverse transcriptase (RNA-dependent DNA polymerase)